MDGLQDDEQDSGGSIYCRIKNTGTGIDESSPGKIVPCNSNSYMQTVNLT